MRKFVLTYILLFLLVQQSLFADTPVSIDSLKSGAIDVCNSFSPDLIIMLPPTELPILSRPPRPPAEPYPSMVAPNDLEFVNTLVGVVGTTPTGALTFTIPIQVPAGTAGMQPQLAIVYNSQSNVNGILGLGFGLAGLSSITRVGRNFYHDNERTGVTLTMDDHFALDGQRLIRTRGRDVIGENGVIFDTEIASFAEIESFGHGGNHLGPLRFEVRARDGSTLHYGETVDSRTRHTVSSQQVVSQWHVSRKVDPNGNVIQFQYYTGVGWANQIREIRYGYFPGGGFLNRIVFNYILKPEHHRRTLYLAGHPIADHRLLSEIRIYHGGQPVKRYSFHYTTDMTRLIHMRKFVPYGSTQRMIGELRFDWSETQPAFGTPNRVSNYFGSSAVHGFGMFDGQRNLRVFADVDGVGVPAIVALRYQNIYVKKPSEAEVCLFGSVHSDGAFCEGSDILCRTINARNRFVIDVNGDGMADIIGFDRSSVKVSLSTGDNSCLNGRAGFSPAQAWTYRGAFSGNLGWLDGHRYPRHIADFNGDGLPDIIGHGYANTYISLNNRGASFEGGWIYTSTFASRNFRFREGSSGSKSLIGDVNGDGRADIVVLRFSESNCNIFGNNCRDFAYRLYFALSEGDRLGALVRTSVVLPYISKSHRHNFFLVDVNGDGKDDFVFAGSRGLFVALSTGVGFADPELWIESFGINTNYSTNSRFKLTVADVNGDGLPDVIAFDGSAVRVALNTGNRFVSATNWTPNTIYWGSNETRWNSVHNFRTLSDVNGDGLPDLIGFDNYGVMVSLNLSGQPMLVGVTDNLGRIFTATYDFLTNDAIYRKGRDPVPFPLMNFQGPLRVCVRLETRSSDKRFTYEGAVIHQQGRGFLGFSRITKTSVTQQLRQVSELELDRDYFLKLPRRTRVYSTVNDQLLSENTQTGAIRHLGGRRILNQVSQTTSRDFLTDVEQRTIFTHDNYGNITHERTYRGLINQEPIAVFVTHSSFTRSAGRNVDNRIALTVSYSFNTVTPNRAFAHIHQRFLYDDYGNLERRIDRPGTIVSRTTYYAINCRGLVTEITVSAAGVPEQKTQRFSYDRHFRFRTSQETVGLGRTGQSFDAWGRILTDTAMGGQITRYRYNVFGRLWQVTTPDNITTTHTIRRANNANAPEAVYVAQVSRPGRPTARTFLDRQGRTVRTETYNPSGMVITQTRFNSRGLVDSVSMPHFAKDLPSEWTIFRYDDFGRLEYEIFESLTTGRLTTRHGHDGLTTYVTDPVGRTSHQTRNALGDLILVVDAMGGEIHYEYLAPGLVNRIIAPGRAVTTIDYDQFGRQRSLTDPNAGTITFRYDAFDRIISQTNARGYTTENRFDRFGRLERVTEGSRVTTYTYFCSGPNIGRLQSVSVNNGTEHIFEYDYLGRIRRFTDVSENNTFVTQYSYDRYGNLMLYRFPSGFALFYVYDENGFKTEIRETNQAGRVIWQLGSVNAMGQEKSSTVLGRSRTQIFNAFGQPTRMTVEGLMDYTYDYDSLTGNMIFRYNPLIGQYERFEYDSLNRLTTGIEFDASGNITWKEGIGEFIYSAFRPHAVDTILGFLDPRFDHDITYTSFQKAQTITAHNSPALLHANFVYGPNRQRRQMNVLFGHDRLVKHYTQNVEVSEIINSSGLVVFTETKEYIFSPFGLVAIRNNGQVNAVATDHLGSIVARFNPREWRYEFFGYTAWGRRYRYENGTKHFFDHSAGADLQSVPTRILDYFARGFTGHEHMDAFGLINMNGRMYDPMIGRFLSPDPFVPDATFTQDFNRYMYARNNPLSYIDPCGEFVIGFLSGFIRGLVQGTGAFQTGWQTGVNEMKIWGGLFASDRNKGFGGRLWETVSRFTWQLPQTVAGFGFSLVSNWAWQVDRVAYWGGATVSSGNFWGGGDGSAVALGSFIAGGRNLVACPHNSLFQHEFGHYLQSQAFGWAYLPLVGIPSLRSAAGGGGHSLRVFEQDANRRAFLYFNRNVEGFYKSFDERFENRGWDFVRNPLNVDGSGRPGQFVDFKDSNSRQLLNTLKLRPRWHDHASWLLGPIGPIGVGLINSRNFNR